MRRYDERKLVLCGLFSALMAVGAFIKIVVPIGIWQVTFSLQLFFALLSGLLLGANFGFMSVLAYLIIGLCGVPVFAHGGGLGYVLKPTFGFLLGFAVASFIAGFIRDIHASCSFRGLLFASLCGMLSYYFCGLVYYYFMFNYVLTLGQTIGVIELISVRLLSTLIPDSALCVLVAVMTRRLCIELRGIYK